MALLLLAALAYVVVALAGAWLLRIPREKHVQAMIAVFLVLGGTALALRIATWVIPDHYFV